MEYNKPHLLISVYLSPTGLADNKYNIKQVYEPNDSFFRLSRFMTSLITLKHIDFKTIKILFDVDNIWVNEIGAVLNAISSIFPDALVEPYRLLSISQWREVSRNYTNDDVIFLQTNDDHALVAQELSVLYEMASLMHKNMFAVLGSVTHQPEFFNLAASRGNSINFLTENLLGIHTNYAVGTTLVRGDFFKSWWDGDWSESELIARPDNPLGKSVTFENSMMVVPNIEILRHMDGYGHISLQKPLAPLRNLVHFSDFAYPRSLISESIGYSRGYWPRSIYGVTKKGVDLHKVFYSRENFISKILVGVARLQSNWCLRISLPSRKFILGNKSLNRFELFFIYTLALTSWSVLRNLPDLIIYYLLKLSLRLIGKSFIFYQRSIYNYYGFFRTIHLFPKIAATDFIKVLSFYMTRNDKN